MNELISIYLKFHEFYLGFIAFFRFNRARIEKRARPPLRPAPIEKPLAEAMTILLSFSHSFKGIESRLEEEEGVDRLERVQTPMDLPLS